MSIGARGTTIGTGGSENFTGLMFGGVGGGDVCIQQLDGDGRNCGGRCISFSVAWTKMDSVYRHQNPDNTAQSGDSERMARVHRGRNHVELKPLMKCMPDASSPYDPSGGIDADCVVELAGM